MLYGFRADIAPINSSLFIRFEIGSQDKWDFSRIYTPISQKFYIINTVIFATLKVF